MLTASAPLNIVVVEDNPVLRDLLDGMLATVPGIALAGHASTESAALALLREIRPRLAIVDLELCQGSGLNVLHAIADAPDDFGDPHTVVFSNHAHPVIQSRARALGAAAFFDKSFQMEELLEYVQRAATAGVD